MSLEDSRLCLDIGKGGVQYDKDDKIMDNDNPGLGLLDSIPLGKVCGKETEEEIRRKMPGLARIRKSTRNNMLKPKKLTKGKIFLITSGLFLIFGSIISLVYTPFDFLMGTQLDMTPGLPPFNWWKNPPDVVRMEAYVFNYTNAEEFLKGTDEVLKVQEVGPFVYRERIWHTNVTFNENGTMTYTSHRELTFFPEASNGNLNGRLIIPNLPFLGGASFMSDYSYIAKLGFNIFTRRLNMSPFKELSPQDYFWNLTDPLLSTASVIMPHKFRSDNMGVLKMLYDDMNDKMTVYIGSGNKPRFFGIEKFRGSNRFGWWSDERCDSPTNSSEGIIYPKFITKNDTLRFLRKSACRVVNLDWQGELIYNSIPAYRFELSPNTLDRPKNIKDDCYTIRGTTPLPSGMMDVSPCYHDLPIGMSFPHFYGGSPELMKRINIEGLKPEKEKHGSYIIVEPISGVPLKCAASAQMNLIVKSMDGLPSSLRKFSNKMIPLTWVKLTQVDIPWYINWTLYLNVVFLPAYQHWISLLFLVIGIAMFYSGLSSHFVYVLRRFIYKSHKFEKISLGYFK